MAPRIPENIRILFSGWSLVTIAGDTVPPRDPDDAAEDEDEDDDEDDEDEPAAIREPDD
jgi:hypothetical protein